MSFGKRNPSVIIKALFDPRHYTSLLRYFVVFDHPFRYMYNYIFGKGDYPQTVKIKTPIGTVEAELYSHHDLLTVNEIFCRDDYRCDNVQKVVVDIGSNIGISALYFLSRNVNNHVFLFEPNPANILKLKKNTSTYSSRIEIQEIAVSDEAGQLDFAVEETGRYGGLLSQTDEKIKVKCEHINEVIGGVVKSHKTIDILKFDTEGTEIQTINAIDKQYYQYLPTIYFEEGISERLSLLDKSVLEYYQMTVNGNTYKLSRIGTITGF